MKLRKLIKGTELIYTCISSDIEIVSTILPSFNPAIANWTYRDWSYETDVFWETC